MNLNLDLDLNLNWTQQLSLPLKCVQLFCLLLDEQIACFSENEQQAVQTTHTQVLELLIRIHLC